MKKIKVLLVDDEEIVLEDLRTLIDWEKAGVSRLYTAQNAPQTERILAEDRIDVIFMDILLPGTDGLTLSRNILQQYPSVQIVILSAYNEFSYATKGIELGVFRYLLKHELTPEILFVLILELREKIEVSEMNRIMMEEQILYSLIMNGPGAAGFGRSLSDMKNLRVWIGAVAVMQPVSYFLNGTEKNRMKVSISELMALEYRDISAKYILSFPDRLLVFAEEGKCPRSVFDGLLGEITSHLQKRTKAPVKYVTFPSAISCEHLKEYNDQISGEIPSLIFCKHCASLLANIPSYGDGNRTGEAKTAEESLHVVSEKEKFSLLSEAVRNRDSGRFLSAAGDILKSLSDGVEDPERLSPFYYAEDVAEFLKEEWENASVRKSQEQEISPVTRFILRYIDENYSKNISLQQIADQLNINGVYAGRIFQKDMGVNFRTYLNDYRIRIAQRLLRTTNDKVFEISEKIGIPNGQYFSKLFRQQTGDSPNEYRQKYFLIDERNL